MRRGIVFDIKRYAIHDGPGIRTTVFLKGCPLSCWWCHNPEGINPDLENIDALPNGNPSDSVGSVESAGRTYTAKEVMNEIERDTLFYDQSGGGVTFSGGEPLMQSDFLYGLLDKCKSWSLHTALDTCGFAPRKVVESTMEKVDLYLFDLKIIDKNIHLKFTGASNEIILSNLNLIDDSDREIIIRFPVIPSVTDTSSNVEGVLKIVSNLDNLQRVDLLPFHSVSKKYERLGKEYKTNGVNPPSDSKMQFLVQRFKDEGINAKVGG